MMILNIFHHQTGDQGSAHLSAWDTLGKASLHWPNHWSQPINFFNVVCTLLFCFAVCTLFFCLGIRLPKQNQKKTTLCLNQSWTSFFCVFSFLFFVVSLVIGFFAFCDIQLPAYTASSLVCIRYTSKLAHQATSHYKNLKANPPNSCAKILSFLLWHIVLSWANEYRCEISILPGCAMLKW